jgi:RND family efflux transporter MFP subunit
MNRNLTFLFLAVLLGVLPACSDHGHPHDEAGGHAHDDHGPADERPTVAVTHWTDRSELFMEYPVFVAGESGRSAIHVTDLTDFSPLSEGEAVVVLRAQDGRTLEFRDGPSRPGIFGVDLEVDQPGVYDMSLRVDAPSLQDLHELGPVTVFEPGAELPGEEEEGEAISFLKEQQWTLEFGTAEVAERGIRSSITVPATIAPRSGGDALLTAPVPGAIDPGTAVPVPGTRVRSGAMLARIAPRSDDLRDAAGLRAALVEAEQAHALAAQERDRAERLVEARALPKRRLDEANAALAASEARLQAARERWSRFESLSQSAEGNAHAAMFAMRAPFDGVISEVRFTAGVSVEANEPLMRIVDPDRVHVVGAVPESLTAELDSASGAELVLDGKRPLALGRPLAVNPVIDPIARTAEVRFSLDNLGAGLRVGQAVKLRLFLGDEKAVTAIPESAVVDDGGRPVVFVQTGGESFERRPVQLGNAAEGFVQVVTGVEAGERVVSRGAYLVRLAAMSTQIPAHGHVH